MTRLCNLSRLFAALLAAFTCLAAQSANDSGGGWSSLTAAQQQVLAPLQRDWSSLDQTRQQKWLEVARRFPSMPADERQRVQARMVEWAKLTPAERTQARLQFQEVRQIPPDERNARWQAYQALPESERKTFVQRAKPAAKAASAAIEPSAKSRRAAVDGVQPKRSPALSASAPGMRPTTPIVVQASPGATTTTLSTRKPAGVVPAPGTPKIAATSRYVDPATLLPKRNPQAGGAGGVAGESTPQQ